MIIATDDIAEGEQITLDYGQRYEWNQPPTELRPAALVKFVKEHTWQNLMESLSVNPDEEGLAKRCKIFSILNSQSSLISLIEAKLIKSKDFSLIKYIVEDLSLKTDLNKVKEALKKEKLNNARPSTLLNEKS